MQYLSTRGLAPATNFAGTIRSMYRHERYRRVPAPRQLQGQKTRSQPQPQPGTTLALAACQTEAPGTRFRSAARLERAMNL